MSETPYFIQLDEARALCRKSPPTLAVEHVNLDNAHQRTLAADLQSLVNDPPFDNSSMDGFACRFDPSATYPLTLRILGTQAASGENPELSVGVGDAARIMTGAPMPAGRPTSRRTPSGPDSSPGRPTERSRSASSSSRESGRPPAPARGSVS